MKYIFIISAVFIFSFIALECNEDVKADKKDLREKAEELSKEILIIDTHIDLPNELLKGAYDVSGKSDKGHFDYARGIEGGLNAAFMSIYIPSKFELEGAKEHADTLIDIVEKLTIDHPDKFILAKSVNDIRDQFSKTKISLPMGMENGSPIEGDLSNLKYFYDRGIRYITLCHGKNNHICDSSGDEVKKWNGLSPFGKNVVAEMNRLGIMIDISHVSDSTFYDVIELSNVPVIASHSGCRAFTPGWERNMNDEMIKLLAKKEGVIQIYFGTALLSNDLRLAYEERGKKRGQYVKDNPQLDPKIAAEKFNEENPIDRGSVQDVVKHIDHVVKLVGIDHVGLGSDFDGVNILPEELSNASDYPNLIYELLKIGYSEEDIRKICSENILRVWSEVEIYADSGK